MNQKNPWEAQLLSWPPRRPSPRIERRLFGRPLPRFTVPKLVTVLAPAAACLLLTLAGVKQFDQPLPPVRGPHAALVALSLSNQSYAPYLPGNHQSTANRIDTFEWTNRGYSRSSVRSFTPTKAIDLQ